MQLDLFREIIVDNFAGGGGASTGIEMATGLNVDVAINPDPVAIAMHKTNHPHTEHYCESVWDVDPREVVKGRKVGLCWLGWHSDGRQPSSHGSSFLRTWKNLKRWGH